VIVPWLLRRRAAQRELSDTTVVSWQSITKVLQAERDDLRAQLDTIQSESRARIRELDEECTGQLLTARRRITLLEAEVMQLHERLRRYEAQSPPPGL
jgi:predicted nuclease with TOPRIM domain